MRKLVFILGFASINFPAWIWFVTLLDKGSFWCIPVLLLWLLVGLTYLVIFAERAKCNKCGSNKTSTTGVYGDSYTQHRCSDCGNIFWTYINNYKKYQ